LAVVLLLELLALGCKWLLLVRVPEPPEVVALQYQMQQAGHNWAGYKGFVLDLLTLVTISKTIQKQETDKLI
jgi:hypothetical protein